MKTRNAVLLAALVATSAALLGCGDEGEGGPTREPEPPLPSVPAGGGGGGSESLPTQPGSGGAGTGGSGGMGPAVQEPEEDAHCAPGETMLSVFAYGGEGAFIENCGFDDIVLGGVSTDASFRAIRIPEPIGPGDVYSYSVDMEGSIEGRMELWGTTEECGPGLELLASAEMGVGVRCMEVHPEDGTYNQLLWVWYGGGKHNDVTFCPGGTCGN